MRRFPFVSSFLACSFLCTVSTVKSQIPGSSSAREIPIEVQKSDTRVDQVIERANDHFRKGKLFLEDSKRRRARDEFDMAVDEILTSGLDVRANQKLQTFYLELVENIYREEVPVFTKQWPPQAGFRQTDFERSPLDPLTKLMLAQDEKRVSEAASTSVLTKVRARKGDTIAKIAPSVNCPPTISRDLTALRQT